MHAADLVIARVLLRHKQQLLLLLWTASKKHDIRFESRCSETDQMIPLLKTMTVCKSMLR